MAEPTSKFQPETLDFIARNARKADLVAKILDLPANALIGAVANEFDTRHNPDLTLTTSGAAGQWLGDRLSQRNAPNPLEIDHRDLEEGYNTTKKVKNLEPGWWEKFTPDWLSKSWDKIHEKATNPAAVDVGPGNIRIETAIDLLKAYTAQHPDEGDDPLALKKYVGRYDLLRDDLLDFNNPDTSLAFSGLMVERAEPFFVGQNKDSWNRLSPDERDALRIMYYKMGPGTLSKNIAKRRAEAQKNGQQYNLNPYGDGGEQHLNNLPGIDNALHLGRVQGERAIPHVPESVREKEPYFYGSGAGLPTSVYRKDVTGTNPQYTYDGYSAVLKSDDRLENHTGFDTPRERLWAKGLSLEAEEGSAGLSPVGARPPPAPPAPRQPIGGRKSERRVEAIGSGSSESPNALPFWDKAVRGRASLQDVLAHWTE
ncbi:hypothetical protein GOD01_22645 [Sinorhizobium medicae]|nr:hypothetical protein [Sinorhizobium medicae]